MLTESHNTQTSIDGSVRRRDSYEIQFCVKTQSLNPLPTGDEVWRLTSSLPTIRKSILDLFSVNSHPVWLLYALKFGSKTLARRKPKLHQTCRKIRTVFTIGNKKLEAFGPPSYFPYLV